MKRTAAFLVISLFAARAATAAEFGGVRAWGMGQAFTAVEGDADAVYYNPAGLASLRTTEFKLNGGSFYQAGKLGYLGGAMFELPVSAMKGNPVAFHFNSAQMEGASSSQAGFTVSGTMDIVSPMNWGATLRYRTESALEKQSALADLGFQSKLGQENIRFGLAVRNLFSSSESIAKVTPVMGFNYLSDLGSWAADVSAVSGKMYASGGWEHALFNGLLPLRLGYYNAENSYVTAGAGAYLWPVGFDVAFGWPVNDKQSGYYQFSLRYRFGGEHFSEVYLNKAVEKAAALEQRIKRLEEKKEAIVDSVESNIADKPAPPPPKAAPAAAQQAAPAAPAAAKTRSAPEPKKITWPQYHRVQQGDTLRDLAQKYYGDAGKWQLIYRANQDKIVRGQPQPESDLTIPEP